MSDKMKVWRKNAKDTYDDLRNIDPEKATKDQFLLFGASLSIMDHTSDQNTLPDQPLETALTDDMQKRMEVVDFVPHSRIDELKQESLAQFIEYMKEKGLEQTTGARVHGEYAETALSRMLDIDYEIAEMMIKSADEQERELIRSAYKDIGKL